MKQKAFKIGAAVVAASVCLGGGIAANAAAPTSTPVVATPSADDAIHARLLQAPASDAKAVLASLTTEETDALFAKYPPSLSKAKTTQKSISTKSPEARAISAKARKCWTIRFEQDILAIYSSPASSVGKMWTGAVWCSNGKGKPMGANWRDTGAHLNFDAWQYQGAERLVNTSDKRRQIFMVAKHKFRTGYWPIYGHRYFCQKMRLMQDGKRAISNSCYPSR